MPQRTDSICPGSGTPQYSGSQILASSGTAQTTGQDAGVVTCSDEEQAVLLRRLGETKSGRACIAQLKGVFLYRKVGRRCRAALYKLWIVGNVAKPSPPM